VSVVVVNYNGGAMLRACVASALASTVPVHVYVSDNGSADGSIGALRTELGDDARVTVVANEANLGFAKGNNVVLASCRSEYVLCLNPDATLAPDCIAKLLEIARQNPDAASIAPTIVRTDRHDLLDGAGDAYHVSGLVWRRGHGSPVAEYAHGGTSEVFSACAAAALYKRSALEAVGGFDEDYFCYLEDVDLGFRLRLAGHRCLYVPDAVAYHVGSATSGKDSDFAVYHGHRNLVWTYVKNMPPVLFWLYLPQHLALNAATVVWYALKGRASVILRSKRDALRGLRGVLEKRRALQRLRVAGARALRRFMNKGFAR
jgi:GT2 family glycosyltransferase